MGTKNCPRNPRNAWVLSIGKRDHLPEQPAGLVLTDGVFDPCLIESDYLRSTFNLARLVKYMFFMTSLIKTSSAGLLLAS